MAMQLKSIFNGNVLISTFNSVARKGLQSSLFFSQKKLVQGDIEKPIFWRFIAILLVLIASGGAARADIWGYVDKQGITHFSAERLDDRYELFFKSGESFDSATGIAKRPGAGVPNTASTVTEPVPARLLTYFDLSPNYKAVRHLLREASTTHGIDYELLQALIATESGFNSRAVSPKGAVGLMQLIVPTAERFGVSPSKDAPVEKKLTDPKTNIHAGSRYLRHLMGLFPGRLDLALAAYNAGEGAVQRAGNKVPNYPETRNYVATVMQLYTRLKPRTAMPAAVANSTGRVRMEMMGGAVGRANMVNNLPPVAAAHTGPDSRLARTELPE